jgi:hypothetical protein
MSVLNFKMPYKTTPELVISPEEVVKLYLFGIPLCNKDGRELDNEFIRQKILNAQELIENSLFIKLTEQFIHETSDFNRVEWKSWGYVKTSYPVKIPCELSGWYNNIKQISYPGNWLSSRKEDSSLGSNDGVYFRQVHIIPSGTTGNAETNGVVYNGATPFALWLGLDQIPNYWHTTYLTGFDKVPRELIDTVGKLAAIQLLVQLGDVYMGVGTNNYSVSLDGLSPSISLLKSNEYGIYGSRIKGFSTDLFGDDGKGGFMETLRAKYKGIIWDVV